jgi:hypothetical protein
VLGSNLSQETGCLDDGSWWSFPVPKDNIRIVSWPLASTSYKIDPSLFSLPFGAVI